MHGDRRAKVLDRVAGPSRVARLAPAAKRAQEDLEVDVDRRWQRKPIALIGAHDARGLRRSGRRERLAERVQREMEVRERGRDVGIGPQLRDQLIARHQTLTVKQQEREQLLRLVRAPAAVADPRAARAQLERTEDECLDALRRGTGGRLRRAGGSDGHRLQEDGERLRLIDVELEIADSLPQRVGERRTKEQEVAIPLGRDLLQRGRDRGRVVLDRREEERGLRGEIPRADGLRRGARASIGAGRDVEVLLRLGDGPARERRTNRRERPRR